MEHNTFLLNECTVGLPETKPNEVLVEYERPWKF